MVDTGSVCMGSNLVTRLNATHQLLKTIYPLMMLSRFISLSANSAIKSVMMDVHCILGRALIKYSTSSQFCLH